VLTLGAAVALLLVAAPRVGAATPCSTGPCAVAEADVVEGPAPLTVSLTGANSLPATGISWYSWDPGDGVPNKVTTTTQHTYLAPGGYTAVLTISTGGQEHRDTVFIGVTTAAGVRPPRVSSASAQGPTEGNHPLTVEFQASATAPDGGALDQYWRLGIGDPLLGAVRQYVYDTAGSYVVRFEAISDLGLRSLSAPTVVTVLEGTERPPLVRVTTNTPAGPPPLKAHLSASMQPFDAGAVWSWDLGDGTHATTAEVDVFYELPGTYWASVVGTHSSGLKGYDSVRLFVTEGDWPAAVMSVPVTRACVGQPYRYAAEARGTPTVAFRLTTAPTGMTVDGATGVVTWTPAASQAGSRGVALHVENASGSDEQQFAIEVSCCTEGACPEAAESSGCAHARSGASGAAGALALVLAFALVRARRRR
jgi:PKD repeat protein